MKKRLLMIFFFYATFFDVSRAQGVDVGDYYPFKVSLGFTPMRNYYGVDTDQLPNGGPERTSFVYQAEFSYSFSPRWSAEVGLGYFRYKKDVLVENLIIPGENGPINIIAEGVGQDRHFLTHFSVHYRLLPGVTKFKPFIGLGFRSQSIVYRAIELEGTELNYQLEEKEHP